MLARSITWNPESHVQHAAVSFPFADGFESGALGPGWFTYTTDEGRVRVMINYACSGNYSALLDDAVGGSAFSYAAIILNVNLSGQPDVQLDFWWRDFSDEDHMRMGFSSVMIGGLPG